MSQRFRVPAAVLCCLLAPALARADDELLGTRAVEWKLTGWINSEPLALKDQLGKVVLVRWWTGGGCPFCAATAPALNEFHARFASRGLAVVGVYHHKGRGPLDPGAVRRQARAFGFRFPVAIDPDWQTLRRWWLDGGDRRWTSVSFLIDRKGVIRHIHPGGSYVKGDRAYEALRAKVEELLNEK
jgi:peroxiredoxin